MGPPSVCGDDESDREHGESEFPPAERYRGGWGLGFLVFSAGLVVAAYAGWARGGAFPGVGSVFLLLLWMALFPPVVGYLRGEKYSSPRYTTVRLGEVLLTPSKELEVAIGTVPYLLVGALLFGGGAFLVGAGAGRLSGR